MQDIRDFFRRFSELKGFDGWMIGQLRFWYGQQENELTSEAAKRIISTRKKGKRYAVLEGIWEDVHMQMSILAPRKGWEVRCLEDNALQERSKSEKDFHVAKNSIAAAVKSFSNEEITAFVKDVGDDNWIHQVERPVVPGLLIAEWLWYRGWLCQCGQVGTIAFHSPVYGGEQMIIYRDVKREELSAVLDRDGKHVLLWRHSYEK